MASFSGIPGAPAYSMSKHGVLGLFRSLYYDALVYGIKIKCVFLSLSPSRPALLTFAHSSCSIVNPFFVSTGIIGVLPKLLIAGIPLATVDEVVAAMVAASTKPDSNGSAFVVDFKCVLSFSPSSPLLPLTRPTRPPSALLALLPRPLPLPLSLSLFTAALTDTVSTRTAGASSSCRRPSTRSTDTTTCSPRAHRGSWGASLSRSLFLSSLASRTLTDPSTSRWGKWAFDVVSAVAGAFKR